MPISRGVVVLRGRPHRLCRARVLWRLRWWLVRWPPASFSLRMSAEASSSAVGSCNPRTGGGMAVRPPANVADVIAARPAATARAACLCGVFRMRCGTEVARPWGSGYGHCGRRSLLRRRGRPSALMTCPCLRLYWRDLGKGPQGVVPRRVVGAWSSLQLRRGFEVTGALL